MTANRDHERGGESQAKGDRPLRLIGLAAIVLGVAGMFAAFPFIYGDPGPGQIVTDPPWFRTVAGASMLLIVLGGGLLATLAIRRSRSRGTKS